MLSVEPRRPAEPAVAWRLAAFAALAVAGLLIVKWHPYYHKAFVAASTHSIGASVVSGSGAAAPAPGWRAAVDYATHYGKSIWEALVLGLVLGSGVETLLPRAWLLRVLGGTRFRSTAVAGLAAIPSMMCTCCSAPLAVGLAQSRVSVGATMAYWLGNPTLNPATLVFMGFVLGWRWVALRLVVGAVLVFGVAHLAGRWLQPRDVPAQARRASGTAVTAAPEDTRPLAVRWALCLGRMAVSLVPEYALLVLALGAVRAWFFPAMTPALGHSLLLVFVLAITGTLFVIPTAAEVPIVGTLLGFGLGSGAAAALLTTLPPVSLPSLVMVGRAVPARVLVGVAVAVTALGLLSALAASALAF